MSRFRLFTRLALFVGIVVGVLIMPAIAGADNASDLDYHENVREAVALADGSSGVLAEINATGALLVEIESGITVGDVTANTTITECSPGTDADNLGKAEDAAHASSDVGVLMIAVENDTLADLAADGDNAVLQVGGAGALYVKGDKREDDAAANNDYGFLMLAIQDDAPLASKIGATDDYGALSLDDVGHLYSRDMSVNAEDAAMTSGDEGQFVLGIVSTTLGAAGEIAGTTGDFAAFTIGAEGALYVMGNQPEDTAFTTGDHGMPIMAVKDDTLADVCADADYASVIVGAEGALYVCGDQVEDTAAGDADYGMPILTIRNDALAALAGTDGDYAMLQVNATGALFATIQGVAALDIGKAEDAAHS